MEIKNAENYNNSQIFVAIYDFWLENWKEDPLEKIHHSLCTELIIYEICWFRLVTVPAESYSQFSVSVLVPGLNHGTVVHYIKLKNFVVTLYFVLTSGF